MSPEERTLIMALYVLPGRQPMSKEQFLREFGAEDGVALGLRLLQDATERRDPLDVELALVGCFTFGFTDGHLPPLLTLAFADWHQRHEDVASALGKLRSPASVDALAHLAQWVPAYLEYDDARALAVKAIWALGGTPGPAAEQALKQLLSAEDEIVRKAATKQLLRREEL
jgi:HEAT repeat protein